MPHTYGDTQVVTAGDISRSFGQWQDKALSGPVVVTHHGRSRVVLISAEHYSILESGGAARGGLDEDVAFETRLSAILEHVSEGFVAMDSQLRVVATNHVIESLVGRSTSQMIGRTWGDLFPTTSEAVIGEQLRRALRTGETVDFETITDPPIERRYAVRAFPYPGGVAALIFNKTAEREMIRELQRAKAAEAALSALSQVMVIKLNIRGVLTEVGEDFARLTGFSSEELLNCRLTDIVQPRDRVALARDLEGLLQGSGPRQLLTTLLVKNGDERPIKIGAAAVINDLTPNGIVAAISLRDA